MTRKRCSSLGVLKWSSTLLSAVILVVLLASEWSHTLWTSPGLRDRVVVQNGAVSWGRQRPPQGTFPGPTGLKAGLNSKDHALDMVFAPRWDFVSPLKHFLLVPLWIPLVASGLATALFWRADVRRRARISRGSCPSCNYDRRGLAADAPCPECGVKNQPRMDTDKDE